MIQFFCFLKDYIESLEDRVEICTMENEELKKEVQFFGSYFFESNVQSDVS